MTNKKIIGFVIGAFIVGIVGTASVYTLSADKDSGAEGNSNTGRKEKAAAQGSASPQTLVSATPTALAQNTTSNSDEDTIVAIAKAITLAPIPPYTIQSTKINGLQGNYAVVTVLAGNNVSSDTYTSALKKVNGTWVIVGEGKGIGLDFGQPQSQSDELVKRYGFSEQFLRGLQRESY
jgi:hypothetical protein